jgi:peptide subunit release factor 1 (eRF1)
MITNTPLQSLINRVPTDNPVLSLFLDMSVNSDNKRTYQLFLQQRRSDYAELDSDRATHHREPLGAAFERAQDWIDANYDQSNRGLALFVEVGGGWIEGIQLPVAVANRLQLAQQPLIGPLVEVQSKHRHYGIVLVDREHCRFAGFYLGGLRHYSEIRPDAFPTPHDVRKGGSAAKDSQSYKAEETRQFFRQFATEMTDLDRRHTIEHWILIGTDENTKNFREFLTPQLDERIIHSTHGAVEATDGEILERLSPFFAQHALQDEASTVDLMRDRLRTGHFAIAGVHDTLVQLQEGKVDTLVIARDFNTDGAQCTRCSFYLDSPTDVCPYCGGELREGVDLVESMIRMATAQEVQLEFVDQNPISELNGVGALLKF